MSKTAIVIGGGPVGCIMSLFLTKRGYNVEVFEKRQDIRTENVVLDRSINLTLSDRGINALKKLGIDEVVVQEGTPLYGRMVHGKDGSQTPQSYGIHKEAILSMDRNKLNMYLLTIAENRGIKINFNSNASVNLENNTVTVNHQTITADLIVGADGAFSSVRTELIKRAVPSYFEQNVIEHSYKQLNISKESAVNMDVNHFHVWPCQTFMLIAMANMDKSFTCTLFMPHETFEKLKTEEQVTKFFEDNFPDALALIGRESLVKDFFFNPTGKLLSIRCKPYHYNNCVLLGDAAHSMVPFYGMGLNVSLEDCTVFNDILESYNDDIPKALEAYTKQRYDDMVAMCNLSMENYIELRSKVTSNLFRLQTEIERFYFRLFPHSFIPMRNMVIHSHIPFVKTVEYKKRQDLIVNSTIGVLAVGILGVTGFMISKLVSKL